MITRTVLDTHPVTIHYQLTEHGKTLGTIIDNLTEWSKSHIKKLSENEHSLLVDFIVFLFSIQLLSDLSIW